MACEEQVQSISILAADDLSAKQFTFMVVDTNGEIDQVGSAGGDADGVLLNKPDAQYEVAELAYGGRVKVAAGDTVTPGMLVQSDGSGAAIEAGSDDHVLGTCLVGGLVGELIEVLLISQHILS